MHFHHGNQFKVVGALIMLDISLSPNEPTYHHHERTMQLWAVVQEWPSQLEKLVSRPKRCYGFKYAIKNTSNVSERK